MDNKLTIFNMFLKKIKFLKSLAKFINKKHTKESLNNEDKPVLNFFNSLDKNKNYNYFEVASGHGRFPLLIKNKFPWFNIVCLEINKKLAETTTELKLKTLNIDILHNQLENENFDIIHCSHIIEHFKYPEVVDFLEEIFRLVRKGGYVIIRSPLWHKNFYNNIDHIRPYPPAAIINYFTYDQQQKTSLINIKTIKVWWRKEELIFNNSLFLNMLSKFFWTFLKFPHAQTNGYVLILQKR
ncbi:class I SAM-dependent methyltransferase [Patescibacteria group bacterium]|nr:class I SAM-dependent methyltransferase [Patescibacteria group bacterium]MBU2250285.1 class I SAM-dependent methyltransferase [Patescibacteria group bacterium]